MSIIPNVPVTFGTAVLTVFLAVGIQGINYTLGRETTGIEIHSLVYIGEPIPAIVQDRTVSANGKLVAGWTAEIHMRDGLSWNVDAPVCHGEGFWPYAAGRRGATILFDDWIGQEGCYDSIPEGATVRICAEYIWSDTGQTDHCSDPFIAKPKDDA